MTDRLISIRKASEILGVHQDTLRIWDKKGQLKPKKTKGNHRRYLLSEVEDLIGKTESKDELKNSVCSYCRVSSNDQKKHGDLDRQKLRVLEYCSKKGYKVEYILEDCCSGMKCERPKLNNLYKLVNDKKINKVIVEHKDRLTRFSYQVFEAYFKSYGVDIEIVEETLPKSFENELVEDMLSLITSFSARLHSRRKRQSKEFRKKQEAETSK
jgi:predicted site-specific integrase-resolvase